MLRDEHRLREKIELSVDERQVAPLAVAALLLFGGVFAVGVYVGKGLASAAPQQQPIGNLDALDQTKDAAVARPKPDEAKAGPAREGAGAKPVGKGDSAAERAATAKEQAAAQDREGADQRARDEKAAQEKSDQAEAQQKAAQVEAQQKAAQAEAQQKAAQVEAQRKVAQAEAQKKQADNEQAAKEKAARDRASREKAAKEKAALRAKALASVAAATGRPEGDSTGSEAAPAGDGQASDGPSGPGGAGEAESFTVQIGSAPDREGADKLVRKARDAGLTPYVVEAKIAGKGTWYRIRVGKFAEKSAAESFRRDVERDLGGAALVMPTRQ